MIKGTIQGNISIGMRKVKEKRSGLRERGNLIGRLQVLTECLPCACLGNEIEKEKYSQIGEGRQFNMERHFKLGRNG